jgi:uncharacterized protein (DUF342 family)
LVFCCNRLGTALLGLATKVEIAAEVKITDRQTAMLDHLKMLRDELQVPRQRLQELFGFTGLPLLEKKLEERERILRAGKVNEADYEEVELDDGQE